MSTNQDDSDVVELALELGGLSITVRGSSSQAADFVRRVAPSAPSVASSEAGESLRPAGASITASSQGYSANGETRDSILSSFPDCPRRLLDLAETSLSSSRLSASRRARRAWLAGQWAKAVLRGRVSSPNRTETIELGNRYWVVLRCSRCAAPSVFTSSASFFAAVGSLSGSNTVSHAFPSETEARIYVEAAGFEFPNLQ